MARLVICGVDDSAGARDAAGVAARLAKAVEAELLLVHVAQVPVVPGVSGVPGGRDELHASAREAAEQMVERVAADAGVGRAATRISFGAAIDVLVRVAAEEEAALLVVGCRGQGHLRAALLGSVSAGVCRSAPCPVVVVPPGSTGPRLGEDASGVGARRA